MITKYHPPDQQTAVGCSEMCCVSRDSSNRSQLSRSRNRSHSRRLLCRSAALLAIVSLLTLCLSSCSLPGRKTVTLTAANGASLKVKFKTTGKWKISVPEGEDTPQYILEIKSPDGDSVLQGRLSENDTYQSYADAVKTNPETTVIAEAVKDEMPYLIWSAGSGEDQEWDAAVELSEESCFVLSGTGSEEETVEAVDRMTLKYKPAEEETSASGSGSGSGSASGSGASSSGGTGSSESGFSSSSGHPVEPFPTADTSYPVPNESGKTVDLHEVDIMPESWPGLAVTEYKVAEKKLCEVGGVEITVKGIACADGNAEINLHAVNSSDSAVTVMSERTTVNGCVVNASLLDEVEKGAEKDIVMLLDASQISMNRLSAIETVAGTISVTPGTISDYENMGTAELGEYEFKTDAPQKADSPWAEIGEEVLNSGGLKIRVCGWMSPIYEGDCEHLLVWVENRTSAELELGTNADVYVNDVPEIGYVYAEIPSGTSSVAELYFPSRTSTDPITKIKVSLSLLDTETYTTIEMTDYTTFRLIP